MLQVCSWQLGARIELTENLSHDGGLHSVVSMRQVLHCNDYCRVTDVIKILASKGRFFALGNFLQKTLPS